MEFGYMVPTPRRLFEDSRSISGCVHFVEVPLHDKMSDLSRTELSRLYRLDDSYEGFVTLHGEGETDGRRKILFSSPEQCTRAEYVLKVCKLVNTVSELLDDRVRALVVHPGTLSPSIPRHLQIQWFADSLSEVADHVPNIELCVESRGCDRHGKVVRAQPYDILLLNEELESLGCRVTHCLDLAQIYVCFGTKGIIDTLAFIEEREISLNEIHLSDVRRSSQGGYRISVPIGDGEIQWNVFLLALKKFAARILIEVIGGLKPYFRSILFLQKTLGYDKALCPTTVR